jgi:2-keto-3-deoxy-L-rhamnonate aldolase RhmA
LRGSQNHRKLDQAIAKIVAAAKEHGKVVGRPARSPAEIKKFQKQGFRFFMTRTDLELMDTGAANLLGPFGKAARVSSAGGM